MIPNGVDNMHVVRALFLYDSDNTGVVRFLCPNDGDNTHAVCAIIAEITDPCSVTVEPFGSCK